MQIKKVLVLIRESRSPAPILCTYMGRSSKSNGNPFHFILNHSDAIASNSYLMLYPKPSVEEALSSKPIIINDIWEYLNSLSSDSLENEGRIYGGGLKKIEPKELGEVKCPRLSNIIFGTEIFT